MRLAVILLIPFFLFSCTLFKNTSPPDNPAVSQASVDEKQGGSFWSFLPFVENTPLPDCPIISGVFVDDEEQEISITFYNPYKMNFHVYEIKPQLLGGKSKSMIKESILRNMVVKNIGSHTIIFKQLSSDYISYELETKGKRGQAVYC